MPKLLGQLELERCPHCNVDTPLLTSVAQVETARHNGGGKRKWRFYSCNRCGGITTATAPDFNQQITEQFPPGVDIDETIPDRARTFLNQAINSLSSPAGAVMLAASSVDAMLKAKGLKQGSLYARIDQAAKDHVITSEMAAWAHEVRLDANDQRHADEGAPLPTPADAKRAVDFTLALAQLMFVLPARVQRGIQDAKSPVPQ